MSTQIIAEATMSKSLAAARKRLIDANMYMRYDYAWKESEFGKAEHRMTGVACRLLYLYEMLGDSSQAKNKQIDTPRVGEHGDADAVVCRPRVFIDANGYPEFQHQIARACELMDFVVIDPAVENASERLQAQLIFVYVSPHGEERVLDQYATFTATTAHHNQHQADADHRPVVCFLLGEAAFLEPSKDDETERMRGLSGFAISQRLTPLLRDAQYSSISQFAVEFSPAVANADVAEQQHSQLSDLMDQFGCMDHNLMSHTEKWELYAPNGSALAQDTAIEEEEGQEDELANYASEDEVRFWLEYTHGKTCDHCHEMPAKLLRCSRCGNTFYCSRECQKAAWRLHKRLCGKTTEEITTK